MSFLKKLFGLNSAPSASNVLAAEGSEQYYEGYSILPAPIKEGGQYRLAGTISREIDGEIKTHHLIRADMFPSHEEAVNFTMRKAKQVIGEQGDRLFR